MEKNNSLFIGVGFFFLISLSLSYASELSGDGTHTIKKGDFITIDNGWKIEIKSVGFVLNSESVGFDSYDLQNNRYSEGILKIEGRKKFGNDSVLQLEVEVLEVFGEELSRAGVSWVEKEYAKINIISIYETLPKSFEEDNENPFEDLEKELSYKDGEKILMSVGEEITLKNGYKITLKRFSGPGRDGERNAVFDLYDQEENLIDSDMFGLGFVGSYMIIKNSNFEENFVELLIIDGVKITFGTGWNLFSIPVEEGDGYGTILESTCNNGTLWVWNNELGDYEKIGILEEGTRIPANKGIWVKIKSKKDVNADIDCEIIVSGSKSVTTKGVKLKTGWNLIGAPLSAYGRIEVFEGGSNFNLMDFEDILGDCKIEKGPWQYLSSIWAYAGDSNEISGLTKKFAKPIDNKLKINRGYFIKVKEDCILGDI